MAAALELRGAMLRYPGGAGVGPIDLAVERGSTVALVGPSGSGKTTLLRLLLGLVPPQAGSVVVRGADLRSVPLDELRRRIGYVVQGGGLFPHLSARGNVALVPRFLRWPRERIDARVEELRKLVRLPENALDAFPAQLSGGQAQRVGLMRALVLDPDVLLLDEPLGALDPVTRADLQEDLRSAFAALGKTVVLVTHDLAEAAFLASAVVILRDGSVVQRGSLDELVRAPADDFVARFVRAQRRAP